MLDAPRDKLSFRGLSVLMSAESEDDLATQVRGALVGYYDCTDEEIESMGGIAALQLCLGVLGRLQAETKELVLLQKKALAPSEDSPTVE